MPNYAHGLAIKFYKYTNIAHACLKFTSRYVLPYSTLYSCTIKVLVKKAITKILTKPSNGPAIILASGFRSNSKRQRNIWETS